MTDLSDGMATGEGQTGASTYLMVPTLPPVDPFEFDSSEAGLEVTVLWGSTVLHVSHGPPRAFTLGDALDGHHGPDADFAMGTDSLGMATLPLTIQTDTGLAVVVPRAADGHVWVAPPVAGAGHGVGHGASGGASRALNAGGARLSDLRTQGLLRPSATLAGADEYPLPHGATVELEHRGFTFVVRSISAARVIGRSRALTPDRDLARYLLGSIGITGLLLVLFYLLPPSASTLSLDLLQADDRYASYLATQAAAIEAEPPEWLQPGPDGSNSGEPGERHADAEGEAGDERAPKTDRRLAVRKHDDTPPQLSRAEAQAMAAEAGIIGLLKGAATLSPTSPYGAEQASGRDATSALGAILGDQIGANFGIGGLGARGTGRGGGGRGRGTIGVGDFGTVGRAGSGGGPGYGRGVGDFPGHKARVPRIRSGKADIVGSLSKEVIRRVIRRHINEVRYCYEQGLGARPDLQGRVGVKFVIDPSGAVRVATVARSSLGEARVEQCIAGAVRRWNFPAPEGGGIVVVTYPFVLSRVGG